MASTRNRRTVRAITTAAVVTAGLTGSAHAALLDLPPGGQVNADPIAGIDPAFAAGLTDIAGGATTAGAGATPWAIFEQGTAGAQQIFVREFVNGAWITRGNPASLNVVPTDDGEAPSIDFAGPGRTVPWTSWYEPRTALGGTGQVFASRFNAPANTWLASGQDRDATGKNPNLNINPLRDAQNPSLAGGATVAGDNPEPWVTWQEKDGAALPADQRFQIFVSRGVKTAAATCAGFFPGQGTTLNGFCWQALGVGRMNQDTATGTTDPTLNVDRTRDGIEPDIAFTGPNDTVPWVVWYETGASGAGLRGNELVFAAKGVRDATAIGGVKWVAVGNGGTGDLSSSSPCAVDATAEGNCSLNLSPDADARDARVAAGTMTPGGTTAPWVAWAETTAGGKDAIFVSRLAGSRFVLANGGRPVSPAGVNAFSPDITFSGNTPYVTWREDSGNVGHGHFEGSGADPRFVLDGILPAVANGADDPRVPVTSLCTANPQTGDGAGCPGGRVGDTVFAYTDATSGTARLLARSLTSESVQTLAASGVGADRATLHGSLNPAGAHGRAYFEYGPTTAYGSTSPPVPVGPAAGTTTLSAVIGSLPQNRTVNYRVVVQTDLGRTVGANQTFVSANAAPGLKVLLPSSARVRTGRRYVVPAVIRVDERATVRVTIKRGKRTVGSVVAQRSTAGAFVLKLRPGVVFRTTRFTVVIQARDPQGAATRITRTLTVRPRS